MRLPRVLGSPAIAAATLLVSSWIATAPGLAQARQAEGASNQSTSHAIDLYREGKLNEAIKVLQAIVKRHDDDADAWYFLGLAFYDTGTFNSARDAFEHLVKLRPGFADANAKLSYTLVLANEPEHAIAAATRAIELGDQSAEPHYAIAESSFRTKAPEKAIEEANLALQIKSAFAPALITKSLAHYSLKQYSEAAACLEQFLAISPNDADAGVWQAQLSALKAPENQKPSYAAPATATTESPPISARNVGVKARVLAKPQPTYTEEARRAGVQGTVVLRCVFGSDGEVKNIWVIRGLGYGLLTRAVKAARQIKFEPATKEGRKVSMYMQLEYNFNLY